MLKPIHFLRAVVFLLLAACAGPGVRFAPAAETAQANARQAQARAQASPAPVASPSPATSPVPLPSPSGSGALAQFQAQLEAVAQSVLPSIVQIDTSGGARSGGVFHTPRGILTNKHPIYRAAPLTGNTTGTPAPSPSPVVA